MNYILSRLLPLRMLGYGHRKSLSWIQKEIYPKPLQTSKMECFATIVNGFQLLLTLTKPLTIVAKHSILDGCRSPGYGSAFISVSPICFLPDSYHHWFLLYINWIINPSDLPEIMNVIWQLTSNLMQWCPSESRSCNQQKSFTMQRLC